MSIVDKLIQHYQKMDTQQKIKSMLQEAEKIRGKLHFQGQKLHEYMSFQQRKITNSDFFFTGYGICGSKDPEVKESFKRAFKSLSEFQMAEFYLQNYKIIYSILNSKQLENDKKDLTQLKYKITIRTNSKQKKQISGTIDILESQKILRVIETKIQIDLHDYILRKSKKGKKVDIILESTQNTQNGQTIRIISFDHQQLLKIIKNLWQEAQYENIKQMIMSDKSFKDLRKNKKNSVMPKTSFIESISSTIRQKNIEMNEIQNQNVNSEGQINEIIKTFANFDKFQHIKFGQYFQKSGFRVRKILQLNSTEQEDIQYYEKLIKYLFLKNSTENEQSKSPNSEVYKKIIELEKELFQLNFRIQTLTIHGSKYLIIQSLQSQQLSEDVEAFSHAKIHHCIWRVRQISHKIEIFVEAKIQYCKNDKTYKKAHKYSSLFLGNLIDVIISKQIKKFTEDILSNQFNSHPGQQINEDDEFKTISGSFIYDQETGRTRLGSVMGNRQRLLSFSITKMSDSAIKHKYITAPRQKKEKRCFRTPKGHWCWQDQWQLRQNGDIVNINKEKISAQSSVLQFILKRMGRNIFAGKSIMNISLPVSIFGKDTNVQRLANGYHFAPTFLEKAAKQTNPIERMKLVMCFGLGFSLNYIQMDKPFNPILGETYQAIVDGCPIYGQQISHHPPISSLYMVGRGYIVYGSFEAKVQFGLNSAAGSNQGFNHVLFQNDQAVVKISTPPGQMSGLIYGQRKVAVIRKTYCIDQKNHLLCQISWGRNKSSQNEQAKYNDFFCGKIVKVKSQVPLANFKNIKTNQIQKEFGMITGRLTKNIFYNGELILDVTTEEPHLIEYYSPCLESDGRFRKDLIYRKQDKVAASQQAKQELEQLQRRDRKLRNAHHPQAH